MFQEYDIVVVGAGHAGCEAAAAAANLGSKVLLVTMNMQTIAQMSCNPAMGGVAKGQIVREIDAMGGYSGIISDKSAIQFRMLNRSKGPAMWSPRTQNDRMLFAHEWRMMLERTPNVDFLQDTVATLLMDGKRVVGVKTSMGTEVRCKSVVLTNGTFLNGIIHIGEKQFGGGRMAERAATGITEQLIQLGFESGRMKTGTPPRIDGRSLDYSKMAEQKGDENPSKFSFLPNQSPLSNFNITGKAKEQRSCWITYTNSEVHELLKEGFDQSPMFAGRIKGIGPRYCPSIEDKINRFSDKERHQLFVEPEGWDTIEIYLNGFSTSLPQEIQYKALCKIPGLENVKMFRPGYAIEYDYFPPHQLKLSLETQLIENLYFAGQINGTTGYEEAACQGLMAGINAHRKINELDAVILKRSEAYIGVLIDDLINKGTEEPYRMFTSRAEYRILLRQDNADLRLTPLSNAIGLASDERILRVKQKQEAIDKIISSFKKEKVEVSEVNPYLVSHETSVIDERATLFQIISRPQVDVQSLVSCIGKPKELLNIEQEISNDEVILEIWEEAEILMKYEGYIAKEMELVDKMKRLEDVPIFEYFDYSRLNSLSTEARQKLSKIRPQTLGQASRISGVNPSDVQVLMVYLGR
ncbi:MAG: tRNA uridine-5-carboxymethylaminomethyl(34) synthesis enzyme MnmG [Chitinophagales bacterium]|nr:tRNA uridine-5-carboxymethylaminomethyl(34) synthesis enzyme MnmG [Chitinophagales bacterium]